MSPLDALPNRANHTRMVGRLLAIIACALMAGSPAITAARIAEHAAEHADADAGHSHYHGDAPHHQHDSDGEPVSPSRDTVDPAVRHSHVGSELSSVLNLGFAPIATSIVDWPLPQFALATKPFDFHGPPGPSPGHVLSLRI